MISFAGSNIAKKHLWGQRPVSFAFHFPPGIVHHLCPGLHAAAKIAIFRVLRKIVSLTIFCVPRDFSLFFVMLIITKPERVADLTKFAKVAKNR